MAELPSTAHGDLLIANLPQIIDDLGPRGAVVSLGPTRLPVRRFQVSVCPFDGDPDGGERGVVFLIDSERSRPGCFLFGVVIVLP